MKKYLKKNEKKKYIRNWLLFWLFSKFTQKKQFQKYLWCRNKSTCKILLIKNLKFLVIPL